ncbi:MAG: L,D-transpeptidase [Anaerolineales bacterium]
MSKKRPTYQEAIKAAHQAYKAGDHGLTRKWANYAARIAPQKETPWLMLGALSDARQSVEYYKRALEINPASPLARKGIRKAVKVLRESQTKQPATFQPISEEFLGTPAPINTTRNRSPVLNWIMAGVVVAVLALTLLVGFGSLGGFAAAAKLLPTETAPLRLAVRTNQLTNTPTPTFTPTPTSTPTPTFTSTPKPTKTPIPTTVPEEPSTNTAAVPDDIGEDEFWMEVNLSTQKLIAHRGDQTLKTFTVSTGTWAHPTVTGHYQVYVMYESTTMSGPGYYLPGVPWTMYFYKGYGVHGAYWHNNFGTEMSHGCVNMKIDEAKWVFDRSRVGTWVVIHY